jgi:hypothetical protein
MTENFEVMVDGRTRHDGEGNGGRKETSVWIGPDYFDSCTEWDTTLDPNRLHEGREPIE